MAWATIRKATAGDLDALEARAKVFARRHEIDIDESDNWARAVDFHVQHAKTHGVQSSGWYPDGGRLCRLWRRVVRRLFGRNADGIAHGYVGYHVD